MVVKTAKKGGFFVPGNRQPERPKFELHAQLGTQLGTQNTKKIGYILGGILRFLWSKMVFWGTF
jgi:hypothetical protein